MLIKINIRKPDDSDEYYHTEMESDIFRHARVPLNYRGVLSINRGSFKSKDPVHDGIKSHIKTIFSKKRNTRRARYAGIPKDLAGTIRIKSLTVFFQKKGGRHHLNGIYLSLDNLSDVLARVIYRSCFTDDATTLNKVLWKYLHIPENVSYALENRVPYFFYEDYEKHDVRLNVQRTGPSTVALEISDGVWGEMSFKELDKYCNFYVHEQKRGSWPYTSPKNLFMKLMGREPSRAELNLMIAFLQQNRKQDIVEKKAFQLINEMVSQRPDKLFPIWKDDKLTHLFVRGNHYDWKLECKNYKESGTQNVSTYVYQPVDGQNSWKGPICIDNANNDSSVGDQFAARAMALINDNFTIKIVSTIDSYINSEPNENRMDENEEMRRVRNNR
jgi:hypothetical protein|tara:strand:- start:1222 stop:2382 length:1161 start_codon:yes stop_codon:yes gene_type:complete